MAIDAVGVGCGVCNAGATVSLRRLRAAHTLARGLMTAFIWVCVIVRALGRRQTPRLGEQTLDCAAVINEFHWTSLTGIDFLIRIDTKSLADRCVDVRNIDGVVLWHSAIFIA